MNERIHHDAFDLLENTDCALMELQDTIRVLAAGMKDYANPETTENVLLHILHSLDSVRAQLDEATTAVMQAIRGTAA